MTRHCRFLLLPLLLCLLGGGGALAQSNNARLQRYEKEIADIRSRIKTLEAGAGDAETQLRLLRAEIDTRKEMLTAVTLQMDSLTRQTQIHTSRIDSLHHRMDTLTVTFNQLVRMAYKTRSSRHWYLYIFSGDTFAQGLRRARYLRDLGGTLRQQARSLQEVRANEEAEQVRLDSLSRETARVVEYHANQLRDLKKSEKSAESLLASIQKDRAAYKKRLEKTIAERDALKKEIDAALAAAAAREKAASSGSSRSASSGSSGSSRSGSRTTDRGLSGSVEVDASLKGNFAASSNKGKLPWPASGTVIERFGDNVDPVYHTTIRCDGITLSTAPGAEIHAIYEGVVTSAVKSKSRFNYIVIIQHGGNYRTIYCYLDDDVRVKVGDKVSTGQLLGHALVSGGTSLVHFQIRNASNAPVDPKPWLRK